jgi:teichuronic acid biosynthesis glycosyltransferase TuaC
MRVLAMTKVFPNAVFPLIEPHIRQQYAALGQICDLEVLATIPWFPGAPLLKQYSPAGQMAGAPRYEQIDGLRVFHPRFLLLPVVGLPIQGFLYAGSLVPTMLRYRRKVDVILATWAYPDGVAAVLLGRLLQVPVVVEVIGSDINLVARMPAARFMLKQFLPHADRVVAVSQQLGRSVAELGVAESRIDVHSTGINRSIFYVREKNAAREQLGWTRPGRMLLFVGRLETAKGLFELVEAFSRLSAGQTDVCLVFVGEGTARQKLEERAAASQGRIIVMGQRPLSEVPQWLGACDALVLPSWAEGTPNVVLEALACGRPVVATNVGGIPDLITDEKYGLLVAPKEVSGLAQALKAVLSRPSDPQVISQSPVVLDLAENARRLKRSLEQAMGNVA